MPFAATWMALEIIILSEVSQTKIMIPLKCGILKSAREYSQQIVNPGLNP